MLVLTRKMGERLEIQAGDQVVEVYVNGISGSKVRLGITAPAEVAIARGELVDREQGGDA